METVRDLILAEHSKAQALLIADIVRQKPELLPDLVNHTLSNEEPLSRRAAWPLRILHEKNPELFSDWIPLLIDQLESVHSKAVLRNVLALLSKSTLPENKKAFLLNYSSKIILDPSSPIAVIAFAADLFAKIANQEVVLMEELLLMLKQIEPNTRGGIQSKTRSIIEKTRKLKSFSN